MKPVTHQMVTLDVTPRQLRELADEISNALKGAKEGDPIPFRAFAGDTVTVILRADIDAWQKSKGGTWE